MTRPGQRVRRPARGFTLIELMIALTISALLVGMILSIFTRMSTAYRTQSRVADLQRTLTAAQDVIQRDVRQAGFGMIDGVRVASASTIRAAVELRDNGSGFGPDELHVFYADPSAQARVVSFDSTNALTPFASFTVDDPDLFVAGDVVVITNRSLVALGPGADNVVAHDRACVVQLARVTGTSFVAATTGSWGTSNNDQCDEVRVGHPTTVPANTSMVYKFVARGYRLDPARRSLGVLQQSPSGGLLANDWQDLGIGFTDLQVASRWYEGEDDSGRQLADSADVDTDPLREWYSGADQDALTAPLAGVDYARPLLMQVRVSLVVRTRGTLDAVGSAQTPALTDTARPSNNDVGNRAAITLAGVPDASRPEELRGDALYRYATIGIDLRNLAVSR
ncbi:MAG: prepilin-type N-terminal cleavage/methylation domain-containing protein [Kofleriaceae bacterium]